MQSNYYIYNEKGKTEKETAVTRLALIQQLTTSSVGREVHGRHSLGRNVVTRTIDSLLALARQYVPPVHWLGAAVTAVILFLYVRLVAFTSHLRSVGEKAWPDLSAGSVLALLHRDAPSLLVAFVMRRPQVPCSIMISGDSRGDCLALLSRMLGLHVVRGDSDEGGWPALGELSKALIEGSCAIIAVDGGGPARVAKVGAVALASAAAAPLLPLAADCYPAFEERHKWDTARNPLPFCTVFISLGPALVYEPLVDAPSIEQARKRLEEALNVMSLERFAT